MEIRSSEVDDSAEQALCRMQFSRYTCPTCNVPYCGLACFRSEAHSQCSEAFYRKEIEVGIKTESSKTAEERHKMLELLKRIEEEGKEEEALLQDSDADEDGEDLARRMEGIDISSASTSDLLKILKKEERDKFFMAVKDPSSELAQQLLASAELEQTRQKPWWEATSVGHTELKDFDGVQYGPKPELMEVPPNMIKPNLRGPSLLYNICALLMAYAHTTRHLSMSPLSSTTNDYADRMEARRLIAHAAPFLVDRKSKVLHEGLSDAVITLWSRFDSGTVDAKIIILLLRDVAHVVRPRKVIVSERPLSGPERARSFTTEHPSATALMALSDTAFLFRSPIDTDGSPSPPAVALQQNHVTMKLTFYAAHLLSTPPFSLHQLADEIIIYSKNVERDMDTSRGGRFERLTK
ncbi:hypothetical protein F5I97DRAFT_2023344 [Phlebopus sp. FC_14]|nr:hypothetical protein F5I97DRAFT_2023344 [Phlebopus sp. FC_14]